MIIAMGYFFSLLKIPFKSVKTWIWMGICLAAFVFGILYKQILPSLYGPVYSRVIWFRFFILTMGIFEIPFLIKNRFAGLKEKMKSPLMWMSSLAVIIMVAFNWNDWLFLIVFFTFLNVSIDRNEWNKIADTAALGFFLTFFGLFTYSLIVKPNEYMDGRYCGIFWYTAKIGEMCALAFLCMVYFLIKLIKSEKKNYYKLAFIIPGMLFSLYALKIVGARSSELGLLCTVVAIFLFLHSKSNKTVWCRLAAIVIAGCIAAGGMFLYAKNLADKYENEEIEELTYFQSHLVAFVKNNHSHKDFKEGTLINALDLLMSERLTIWYDCIKDITPWGEYQDPISINTHNTYLYWLVDFGYLGGVLIIWYGFYLVTAVSHIRRNEMTALMPFLVSTFMFGLMMGTSEYLCGEGMSIIMLVQYPLLQFVTKKDRKM